METSAVGMQEHIRFRKKNSTNTGSIVSRRTLDLLLMSLLVVQLVAFLLSFYWRDGLAFLEYLSVLNYVLFCIISFYRFPVAFVLMFYFIFGQLGAILSILVIEGGAYLIETFQYGYVTGANARLVLYCFAFFVPCFYVIEATRARLKPPPHQARSVYRIMVPRLCLGISLAVIAVNLAGIIAYGSPFFMQMDRFTYWYTHPNPIFKRFCGYLNIAALLAGLAYAVSRYNLSRRRLAVIMFLAAELCGILLGEKFSGLFLVLLFFITPILVQRIWGEKKQLPLKKAAMAGVLVGTVFFLSIVYNYSRLEPSQNPIEKLKTRFALQGQVWWSYDRMVLEGVGFGLTGNYTRELGSWFNTTFDEREYGLRNLMTIISPWWLVSGYFERGVVFTMGYPAVGLHMFGYPLLIVWQVLVGALTGLIAVCFGYFIWQGYLVRTLFAYEIYLNAMLAFVNGDLFLFFGLETASYVALLIVGATGRMLRHRTRLGAGRTV